jgi:hypothetical protein
MHLKLFKVEIGSICSKYAYSADLKKHMYLSEELHLYQKLQYLLHGCPVIIELLIERNTSCKSEFSRWRKAHFAPSGLFSLGEETRLYLERKPSLLEAKASSTLFPCEN